MIGSKPIYSTVFNNQTVAASAGGTANATTLIKSVSVVHANYVSVSNKNPAAVELVFGREIGTTAAAVYIPGRDNATAVNVPMVEFPIPIDQGTTIRARTLVDTPITFAVTTFLHLSLWE